MDNIYILLAWVAGIIIVFTFGKALKVPLKIAIKLLVNGLLGGLVIAILNLLGQYVNFYISLIDKKVPLSEEQVQIYETIGGMLSKNDVSGLQKIFQNQGVNI
jgi:hypothetical protein